MLLYYVNLIKQLFLGLDVYKRQTLHNPIGRSLDPEVVVFVQCQTALSIAALQNTLGKCYGCRDVYKRQVYDVVRSLI